MPSRPRRPLAPVTRFPATSGPAWRPIRIARRCGGTSATTCSAGSRPTPPSWNWAPDGATSPTTSTPAGWSRWTWTRRCDAPPRRRSRPNWVTAPISPASAMASSTWSSPRTCSNISSVRPPPLLLAESARVLRPGGRLILLQPNFRLNPGVLLRRLHPRRDLHRPVVARLPGLGGVADRGEIPAIPPVDDEEQGLGAELPGALVPPVADQAAGRPDVGHRHAGRSRVNAATAAAADLGNDHVGR